VSEKILPAGYDTEKEYVEYLKDTYKFKEDGVLIEDVHIIFQMLKEKHYKDKYSLETY
jgi:hypothetical protein